MGITISEPITGSILAECPLLIISFLTNVLIVLIILNLSYDFLIFLLVILRILD